MSKALDYFKKVYEVVPQWVQVMHDYNSEMLEAYTSIRAEAFKSSELLDYEKDELIASMNAGRLYSRSMGYHTTAAFNKGSKLEDLIEYILVAYVYKGEKPLYMGLDAILQFLFDDSQKQFNKREKYDNLSEVVDDIISWTNGYDQSYLLKLSKGLKQAKSKEEQNNLLMENGHVSTARKYLCLTGMYITELDGKNSEPYIEKARDLGVTEAELADLGFIIILTAGIPSWFEISDHLKTK